MTGANLEKANLTNTDFVSVKLKDANIKDIIITGSNLTVEKLVELQAQD